MPRGGVKATPSQSAAGLIVAALALCALAQLRLASQRAPAELARAPIPASAPALRALSDGESFELNRATQQDLQLLPGVGPKLAARILQERARRGGFRRVEDLLAVQGIGPAKLERLARFVRVETTDRTAAPR